MHTLGAVLLLEASLQPNLIGISDVGLSAMWVGKVHGTCFLGRLSHERWDISHRL